VAWAGVYNTFFCVDAPRKNCAVILMPILPFIDEASNYVVEDFERAVYALPLTQLVDSAIEAALQQLNWRGQ
jgi:hypothetical protein